MADLLDINLIPDHRNASEIGERIADTGYGSNPAETGSSQVSDRKLSQWRAWRASCGSNWKPRSHLGGSSPARRRSISDPRPDSVTNFKALARLAGLEPA